MTGPSIFRDPGGVLGRDVAPTVFKTVAPIAWVAVAVSLVLIIAAVNPRLGGWLLIVLVMGMVYGAHKRKLF